MCNNNEFDTLGFIHTTENCESNAELSKSPTFKISFQTATYLAFAVPMKYVRSILW